MIDKAFCDAMAAVAALKAASYSVASTSKMKKGYVAEAEAWTALGARLSAPPVILPPVEPPPVTPPPVTPPPSGLMWALDPAQYQAVGAPSGAPTMPSGSVIGGGTYENARVLTDDFFGPMLSGNASLVALRRCTIDGAGHLGVTGAWLNNVHLVECEIVNCDNFLRLNGDVTIERCWMHGSTAAAGSHVDGIEFWSGGNIQIIDSRIEIPTHNPSGSAVERGATAAANLRSNMGPIHDVIFRRSVLLGGGMPLLVRSEGDPYRNTNVRLDDVILDGGYYGAVNGDSTTPASITQWDNVRKLDGTPIPRP